MTALRNFVITLLLSLLIFGLIAYGLVQFAFAAFDLDESKDSTPVDTEEPIDSQTNTGETVNPDNWLDVKGNSFTALLVGTDFQPDFFDDYDESIRNETGENGFPREPRTVEADTIILVRVNKETGECVYCAIPANTKITVDGLPCKLQDLYSLKGIDALCEKVMALTGLPIDYYAVITVDNFKEVIDKLGGITYYVETDMYYVDESLGLYIDLRRGSQKLNGKKALVCFVNCGYADGDTSRRQCAVKFLKELFKKLIVQSNYSDAAVLYSKYSEYFDTNFTINDLGNNVDLIFSYSKMSILDFTYPGTTVGTGESAYFTPNISKATEYFKKYKFIG